MPPVPDHDLRIARRLGVSAVVGAIAWVAAFFVVSIGPIRYDEAGAYRDGAARLPLLFLAVVLLSAGLGGQLLVLPRDARLARLGAGGAIPFLLLWGLQPWLLPLILVTLAGLIALAVGARRSGAWATGPSVVMIGSCLAVVAITWFGLATSHGDRMAGGVFLLVGAAVLIPAWLVVGGTLIRRPGEAPRRS